MYLRIAGRPIATSALHRNILDVFNEHGVQIMTPAYEGEPEQPKVVPKELWYSEPAVETSSEERRDVHPLGMSAQSDSAVEVQAQPHARR